MGGSLIEITDQNFSEEVLSSDIPVVVDFWAEWCGPCKLLTPIFTELSSLYTGKVKFGKVDVDNNPQTAAKYGISNIPSLLFFRNGNIVAQHTGLLAKGPLQSKIDKAFE